MKFSYAKLVDVLTEENYIKHNQNSWIISKDEDTGQNFLLVVEESEELNNLVKEVEKEILKDQEEAELPIRLFGIVFSQDEVIFLRIQPSIFKINVQKLRKNLHKISAAFLKKLRNLLLDLGNYNIWDKLFDRTDIINEFYILYSKAKEKLLNNIIGITDDIKKEEYADNLLLQLLIIWYLQEKRFFDSDKGYLLNRFNDYISLGYKNYLFFLKRLFKIMMSEPTNGVFNDQTNLGKIIVTGPAPFLNGDIDDSQIYIPDKVFYSIGETDFLKKTDPNNVSSVSILNLFESRDWTEGNIDEYVLGAIYEKLISNIEKKKSGTYYTPEEITAYICRNSIEPFLVDGINNQFRKSFLNLNDLISDNNTEILVELFKRLRNIKILDPAVGSAHFLESAVEVLLKIYRTIYIKLNDLDYKEGIQILTIGELGKLKKINLLEVSDEEQFNLYIKFFIILSKNIYGVDINPTAINVARARLFLNLAKHFDSEKGYSIRFPNIHFNLRLGNSLIGYVIAEKETKKKHVTLDSFLNQNDINSIKERIKLVSTLESYLIEVSKTLKLKGDIIEEIQELNHFLVMKDKKWKDFNKILKTKSKLVKILIISLNTTYAIILNELLTKITKMFNDSLIEKFAIDYNVNLEQLLKVKPFFWNFEFSEVFLDESGFDIVIGNPPYGNILSEFEKSILEKEDILKTIKTEKHGLRGSKNTASMFVEKGYNLLNENGYLGMILPKSCLFIGVWERFRAFLLKNVDLKRVVDNSQAFPGVKLEMSTIVFKKSKIIGENVIVQNLYMDNLKKYSTEPTIISKSYLSKERFITEIDGEKLDIFNQMNKNSKKLGEGIAVNFRGLNLNRFVKDEQFENSTKIIRGKDINRFKIRSYGYIDKKYDLKSEEALIIVQRIVAHIQNPKPHIKLTATLNEFNEPNVNTITNIKIVNDQFLPKYILIILNSNLLNWYLYKYLYINAIRSMDFVGKYAGEVPIKIISLENQRIFEIIADYLLFLNNYLMESDDKELKQIKKFYKKITDSMIYEIYFKEEKINVNIIKILRNSIIEIEYDKWRKLNGNKLELEILNNIKKSYEYLRNQTELNNKLDIIRNFHWVKIIEN